MRRWAVLLALVAVGGCEDKSPIGSTGPVGTAVHVVRVTPDSTSLAPGKSLPFTAVVSAEAGQTERSVIWSTSDAAIASVTAAGVVTAGTKLGRAFIIAAAKADATVSGAAVVIVVPSSAAAARP